jgi:iron complex outermembrane receptor protein
MYSTALVAVLGVPGGAQAQDASAQKPAADSTIQDIVVTAQRREENVQKTALSIEVFGSDALAKRGVGRMDDLSKVATGVQIGGGTQPLIYIRGVGDFGVLPSANPAVVTNFDGVPISRPQGIAGNFFDLERLEVLKGPQGTLYGRNATGGAINIIAAPPKLGDFSGFLTGTVGNYSTAQAEGAVNVPLGEDVAVRLSGQYSHRDGYLQDGRDDDKHYSLRGQVLARPTDRLTVHLRAGYIHYGGNGPGLVPTFDIPGASPWAGTGTKVVSDYLLALSASNYQKAVAAGCNPAPAPVGNCPVPPALIDRPDSFPKFQTINNWNVDGQIDYDFGGATLTVIPAYRYVRDRFASVPSFVYTPGGFGSDGERSKQSSVEARLGNNGPRLKWTAGFFHLNEDQSGDYVIQMGTIQRVRYASNLGTNTNAAFGEATYSVASRLRVIGGVRYTADQRTQTDLRKYAISPTVTAGCLPPTYLPGTLCNVVPAGTATSGRATFKRTTWKAGLEYDVAERSMLFATVSTGFKAGGFNTAIDPKDISRTLAFNPEKITAYTVGSRNRFLNNKLQVNLEAFYWDYRDLQLSSIIIDGSGNQALATQNAGRARVYGLDLDVTARPAPNTTLHSGIEIVNSKYKSFGFIQPTAYFTPGSTGCASGPSSLPPGPAGPLTQVDCSGRRLALSPKWSITGAASQVFPLPDRSNLTLDVDAAYTSKRYLNTSFIPNSLAGAYFLLNGSLTYNAPGNRWFVSGYIRNITKSAAYLGGAGGPNPFVIGFDAGAITAPRTFGARFGVRF